VITIDTSSMMQGVTELTNEQFKFLIDRLVDVGEMARAEIRSIAEKKLSARTYMEYMKGLQEPLLVERNGVTLTLVGDLPNMLEQGFPSFDMKPGILKGAPYKDVHFEYAEKSTPKGPPTLSPAAASSLKAAVKKGKEKLGKGAGTFVARGGNFKAENAGTTAGGVPKAPPGKTWTTSKSSGARKEVMMIGGKEVASTKATTFRRVSKNSPDDKFWHPGLSKFEAVNGFDQAAIVIEEALPKILADMPGTPNG
jgi:hypothetical protein